MKHWFQDQHFRSLLKNTSYLAVSRIFGAIGWVAALSLAAHGLGVVMFGALILISSYVRAASGLSKFQSWQLIVRYGGEALRVGSAENFKASTGFAFALDMMSGIGGMLIAVAVLPLLAGWVGIKPDLIWLTMLYCTVLPTMSAATPTGVLRTLDRFDLVSWQSTATPISRAILCAFAYLAAAPFAAYVVIWYVTDLGSDLYFWYLAGRELRRHGLLEGIRPTLTPTTLPGAWRFAININLTASLEVVWGPIANLIIGGLLGPAGAGLFRIANSLSDSAQKPADMLAKAFYPEIMRMDLKSSKPWKLMLRGTALASGIAILAILILLLGGKPIVSLLFGKQFLGAYDALLVLMMIPFLGVFSFPLTPMLYALDRPDGPLKARLIATLLYFIIVAPLCWRFGVMGAAIAFVIGHVALVATLMFLVWLEYRRVHSGPPLR